MEANTKKAHLNKPMIQKYIYSKIWRDRYTVRVGDFSERWREEKKEREWKPTETERERE